MAPQSKKLIDALLANSAVRAGRILRNNPKMLHAPIGPKKGDLHPPIFWAAAMPGRRLLDYLVGEGVNPNGVEGIAERASLFNLTRLMIDGLKVDQPTMSRIISMWDNRRVTLMVDHGYKLTAEDLVQACHSGNLKVLKMCVDARVPVELPRALVSAVQGGYCRVAHPDAGGVDGSPIECTVFLVQRRLVDAASIESAKKALEGRLKDPQPYYRGVAERLVAILNSF